MWLLMNKASDSKLLRELASEFLFEIDKLFGDFSWFSSIKIELINCLDFLEKMNLSIVLVGL